MKAPFGRVKTALVPIRTGTGDEAAIALAKSLAEQVVLVGIVPVVDEKSISGGAMAARAVRKRLLALSGGPQVRFKSNVIVSDKPIVELNHVILREKPELIIAEWRENLTANDLSPKQLLMNPSVDVILIRAAEKFRFGKTLVAVRGGPYAELALRIGLSTTHDSLDLLHMTKNEDAEDASFKGIKHILSQMPEVNTYRIVTEDIPAKLVERSAGYDIVILGASSGGVQGEAEIGMAADLLLRKTQATVLIVKTHREIQIDHFDERASAKAISILVDKWFAENTYQADEFANIERLVELKKEQGLTLSLALPALNEETTVGKVITTIRNSLMDEFPLLDEIVLMDSNSTDKTREIAKDLGIPVFIHQEILPELGPRVGKGEALWKSLFVTKGDLVAWIDTDIVNIHPRFVYGILGPLLMNSRIQLVKGFYRRPLKVGDVTQAGGGGRVTELTARPLLNLFYPALSGVIQPLSGEYAGRRSALEKSTFYSGYGVETGLLIDIFEQYGLGAIAQVDLLKRIHHNQELDALSKMSFAIIQTVMHKLEQRYERSFIEDVNKTMKMIRYRNGEYFLDVAEIIESNRPPIITLQQYRELYHR